MNKRDYSNLRKTIISVLVIGGCFFAGYKLMPDDCLAILSWWLTLLALGVTFVPTASLLFAGFHDKGWIFSKVLGIAFAGWLMWLLSSMRFMKFTETNCLITVIVCFVINLAVLFVTAAIRSKKESKKYFKCVGEILPSDFGTISSMLAAEAIFSALFIMWVYLKCFNPKAYGTEKFMDYGFMAAILRSDYMPPNDPWLAGHTINYYYVGQYLASYVTRLSRVSCADGYNLMLMTIASMGFALPYTIAHNIAEAFTASFDKMSVFTKKAFTRISGVLAGLCVAFISNLHYMFYALIIPHVRDLLSITGAFEELGYTFPAYYFPNSTRYIGYNPVTNDKTIHEFPSYSFVLGDLHAHVVNIIFVLAVTGMLFAFLKRRKKARFFEPVIFVIGFFIGLFHMTNFWDYPIYFVVSGAVILFSNARLCDFKKKTFAYTLVHAVTVVGIAKLTALPFTLKFNQISSSVRIAENHTPLYQYAILWALPIAVTLVFLVTCIKNLKLKGVFKDESTGAKNPLFKLIGGLNASDLFVITIGLCAIGLIILPEIIYVKDIYSGAYKRANTMFKLTYQAFILFGIVMGYAVTRWLFFAKTKARRRFAVVALILILISCGYFFNASKAWFVYNDPSNFKGLDATAFLEEEHPEDSGVIDYINKNIEGSPTILEANGASYTYYERISAMTGCPTVLGWKTHEWLWQSNGSDDYPEICTEREYDVERIYTSDDEFEVRALIDKYRIDYIYVGRLEKEKYEETVNDELLKSLGQVVFPEEGSDESLAGSGFLIKIKK